MLAMARNSLLQPRLWRSSVLHAARVRELPYESALEEVGLELALVPLLGYSEEDARIAVVGREVVVDGFEG